MPRHSILALLSTLAFAVASTAVAEDTQRPVVLLVIANQDFFYREYADPREELEKASVRVVVAAGRKGACRPHRGTGQGNASGEVAADIAVAEAKPDDYDAILFAGGYGASMYQPAFPGTYANSAYNGDVQTRAAVGELIGTLVKQEKMVGGICHGVSVLAWTPIGGKSLLAGVEVCAPTIQGPPFQLAGQRGQGPSRWHAEFNGAKVAASGSIGQPRDTRDDVLVSGRIITAENDQSARQCGRVLAELLVREAGKGP